jgi:hypothetical protein
MVDFQKTSYNSKIVMLPREKTFSGMSSGSVRADRCKYLWHSTVDISLVGIVVPSLRAVCKTSPSPAWVHRLLDILGFLVLAAPTHLD